MTPYILLEDHTPVPIESDHESLTIWANWMSNCENIIVKQEEIDGFKISTVFLGLDHNWYSSDRPLLFETMIFHSNFKSTDEEYKERCSTWDEALIQHAQTVEFIKTLKV